jgi:hypothetical protein
VIPPKAVFYVAKSNDGIMDALFLDELTVEELLNKMSEITSIQVRW